MTEDGVVSRVCCKLERALITCVVLSGTVIQCSKVEQSVTWYSVDERKRPGSRSARARGGQITT